MNRDSSLRNTSQCIQIKFLSLKSSMAVPYETFNSGRKLS